MNVTGRQTTDGFAIASTRTSRSYARVKDKFSKVCTTRKAFCKRLRFQSPIIGDLPEHEYQTSSVICQLRHGHIIIWGQWSADIKCYDFLLKHVCTVCIKIHQRQTP